MAWKRVSGPVSFAEPRPSYDPIVMLIERIDALEQRVRELEARQEQNDDYAHEQREREG